MFSPVAPAMESWQHEGALVLCLQMGPVLGMLDGFPVWLYAHPVWQAGCVADVIPSDIL